MPPTKTPVLIAVSALALTVAGTPHVTTEAREQTTRTVYVTVTGNDGQPVADLTPKDFRLRENNRDREITSVEPAAERLRVALLVEELLAPTNGIRQGLFAFAKSLAPRADISLVLVSGSNREVVPYTGDLSAFVAGINSLAPVQRPVPGHIPDGIFQVAEAFTKERPARPVIVVVALAVAPSDEGGRRPSRTVLDQLRDANALLHAVAVQPGGTGSGTSNDASERAQVLSDAPRQTGGRQWQVSSPNAAPAAMAEAASDLLNQYKLTYVLPAGEKPSDRLAVSSNRRSVTLRAPTRIRAAE